MDYIVGYAQERLSKAIQPFYQGWIAVCDHYRGYRSPQYEDFAENFLVVILLSNAYQSADQLETFRLLQKQAKSEALISDCVFSSTTEWFDWVEGFEILCRDFSQHGVGDAFASRVPESVVCIFVNWLRCDVDYATCLHGILLNALRRVYSHYRAYQAAKEEISRIQQRFLTSEEALKHSVRSVTDPGRASNHRQQALSQFQKMIKKMTRNPKLDRKYQLPADHDDEMESVLTLLLGEQLAPISGFDSQLPSWKETRTLFEWLENRSQRVIPNIFQGLERTVRDQNAQQRQPDVIANRAYLDAESEDGRSYYEILAEEYPESGLAVDHEETSEEELLFQFRSKLSSLMATQRKEIENILSEGAFRKREEIGERKFKVMEIWVQEPTKTDLEIAVKLGLGEESRRTIANDRADIEQKLATVFQMVCG